MFLAAIPRHSDARKHHIRRRPEPALRPGPPQARSDAEANRMPQLASDVDDRLRGPFELGFMHLACLPLAGRLGRGRFENLLPSFLIAQTRFQKQLKAELKAVFRPIRGEFEYRRIMDEYAKSVFAVGIALSRLKRSQTCGCSFSLQLKNCRR